ncbi:hypothetical protein [Streptomyces qinglanensis]|uniref:hypothetical protein n=1 Tax=Streptomyces qinglanensis TaxID=943816 RepID=UPI003D760AE3
MIGNPLYRDTVTVIDLERGEDERGNETWAETERTVSGCNMQPMSSTEVIEGKAQVITRMRLAGPPDMGLTATSRVRHAGVTYEVDGRPGVHHSYGAVLDHTEAILMEVTG